MSINECSISLFMFAFVTATRRGPSSIDPASKRSAVAVCFYSLPAKNTKVEFHFASRFLRSIVASAVIRREPA